MRFFISVALAWTCSIYIQRKRVWNKKGLNFRWSWLYGKHVRHSVFVCPWNKNGEQNGNDRWKQARVCNCFSEQHAGTRAICWLVCRTKEINKKSPLLFGGLPQSRFIIFIIFIYLFFKFLKYRLKNYLEKHSRAGFIYFPTSLSAKDICICTKINYSVTPARKSIQYRLTIALSYHSIL